MNLTIFKRKSGIYKITSPSGKVYIGESLNLYERFMSYKRLECKSQIRLYNSLLKYGFSTHTFCVLELCSRDNLICRERFWQDVYDVLSNYGLNCILSKCGDIKAIISEKTRLKIKEKLSGSSHPNYGKKRPIHSLKMKGHKINGKKVINNLNNEIYESAKQCSNSLEISYSGLRNHLSGYKPAKKFKHLSYL